MKKVFKNSESPKVEFFRRMLYSFQVLMVGIALPLLFLVGISDGNQKKSQETEVKEITTVAQLPATIVAGSHIKGI